MPLKLLVESRRSIDPHILPDKTFLSPERENPPAHPPSISLSVSSSPISEGSISYTAEHGKYLRSLVFKVGGNILRGRRGKKKDDRVYLRFGAAER